MVTEIIVSGSIPEMTVRRAMSWTLAGHDISFDLRHSDSGDWELTLAKTLPEQCKADFFRVLNEFRLRELIDDETAHIRKRIVKDALTSIYGVKK